MIPHDARIYQILCLFTFLILGIGTRDWTLQPEMILIAIATCLLTQSGMQWLICQEASGAEFVQSVANSIPSALITSLGLSLLLRADHYSTIVLS